MKIKFDLTDEEWKILILNIQQYESEWLFKTTSFDNALKHISHKDYTDVNNGMVWLQCIVDEIKFSTTAFYMFEKIKNNRNSDCIELVSDEKWIFELFYDTQMATLSETHRHDECTVFHRIFICKLQILDN